MFKRLSLPSLLLLMYSQVGRAVSSPKLPVNPQDQALAQLHDIHSPAAISWWPLAPGWYGIAVLVILFVTGIIFFLHRHHQYGRAKRDALRLLRSYRQQHKSEGNSQLSSARVSELLKRVALVYFPREQVANLQGEAWIAFLNNTAKKIDFNEVHKELVELPYHPPQAHRPEELATRDDVPGELQNLNLLFNLAQAWIKQRRKPCLN